MYSTLPKVFSYPQLSSLLRSNGKRERIIPVFLSCQKPGQEEKQELDRWQEGGEVFCSEMGADEGGKLISFSGSIETESHYKSCLFSLGLWNIVRLQKLTQSSQPLKNTHAKWKLSHYIQILWKSVIEDTRAGGLCWLLKLRQIGPSLDGLLASSCQYNRFCPVLAALIDQVQNIFFLTVHYFNSFFPITQKARQAVVPGHLPLNVCLCVY